MAGRAKKFHRPSNNRHIRHTKRHGPRLPSPLHFDPPLENQEFENLQVELPKPDYDKITRMIAECGQSYNDESGFGWVNNRASIPSSYENAVKPSTDVHDDGKSEQQDEAAEKQEETAENQLVKSESPKILKRPKRIRAVAIQQILKHLNVDVNASNAFAK